MFPAEHCFATAASSTVEASVLNHSSLLGYNKEVLDQIAKPVLFQCSDNDSQIPTEFRHEIEEKLRKLPFKKHTLLKFYPGEPCAYLLLIDIFLMPCAKSARQTGRNIMLLIQKCLASQLEIRSIWSITHSQRSFSAQTGRRHVPPVSMLHPISSRWQ